jgi:hypothetical protein
MIRFLIHTTSSKTDIYGNRYHFATITSTKTGKFIPVMHLDGPDNAAGQVRNVLNTDWSEIHATRETQSIRQFNALKKFNEAQPGVVYEHDITADMLKNLEEIS